MWPFEPDAIDTEALEVWERVVVDLRHEPDGPQDERQWADLGRQLNRLAALRAPEDPAGAVEAFDEACAIWERIDRPKAAFVSKMRLSVVLARLDRFDEAHTILEDLIDRAYANPVYGLYLDSLWLHRAAVLCAQGVVGRALEDLERVAEARAERKPGSEESIVAWIKSLRTSS